MNMNSAAETSAETLQKEKEYLTAECDKLKSLVTALKVIS